MTYHYNVLSENNCMLLSFFIRHTLIRMIAASFLLSFLGQSASASDFSLQAGKNIFPDPSLNPKTLVEFTYSIDQKGLSFLPDSATGAELAGIFSEILILDSSGGKIDSINRVYYARKPPPGPNGGAIRVFDQLNIALSPGKYHARLNITDLVSKESAFFEYDLFTITPLSLEGIEISDICMSFSITDALSESRGLDPLIRNGFRVIPNPMGLCSFLSEEMFFYAEAYGLKQNDSGMSSFSVEVQMRDAGTGILRILDSSTSELSGSSAAIVRQLKHGVSAPGRQEIILIVNDLLNMTADTVTRKLTFYRPAPPLVVSAPKRIERTIKSASFLDTADIQYLTDLTYWIMLPPQRREHENLTLEGKRAFIIEFWRSLDPDLSTKENAELDDALERFKYSNDKFSYSRKSKDGWRSDRGRVIMKYGVPDEVINMPMPSIGNDITGFGAWERWDYDGLQGGVYFIFSDEHGYGYYRLAHSNAQGERFDRQLESRINTIFRASGG